jgi:hypothetical protein
MPKEHKLGTRRLASSIEISNLVRAYGITRDQARRLITKFGNNRAKLSEAARVLKARLAAPREAALQSNGDRSESPGAARSLDADWRPHQAMTITDLVAEARAADWDFTNWCYASGHDASDPDVRRMFERLLAYCQARGARRLELTGRLGASGYFQARILC